eukprot:TRINITY_DN12761_c1_g1_i3.p1 TRINITY_DN12761_c1_g1~~TRINITY_DN12761_c1_g1_i3.p1  ORF type:complete len:254 (+),score=-27.51 TRINITY_DN12761_c1_g1_i3:83-763(+)
MTSYLKNLVITVFLTVYQSNLPTTDFFIMYKILGSRDSMTYPNSTVQISKLFQCTYTWKYTQMQEYVYHFTQMIFAIYHVQYTHFPLPQFNKSSVQVTYQKRLSMFLVNVVIVFRVGLCIYQLISDIQCRLLMYGQCFEMTAQKKSCIYTYQYCQYIYTQRSLSKTAKISDYFVKSTTKIQSNPSDPNSKWEGILQRVWICEKARIVEFAEFFVLISEIQTKSSYL